MSNRGYKHRPFGDQCHALFLIIFGAQPQAKKVSKQIAPTVGKLGFAALARRGQVLILSDKPEDGPNVVTREDDITL